jgi:hypothetical protein
MIGMVPCKLRDEGHEKGKRPCDPVSTDHTWLTNMQSGETSCKRRHVWSRAGREIIGPSFSALLESARERRDATEIMQLMMTAWSIPVEEGHT